MKPGNLPLVLAAAFWITTSAAPVVAAEKGSRTVTPTTGVTSEPQLGDITLTRIGNVYHMTLPVHESVTDFEVSASDTSIHIRARVTSTSGSASLVTTFNHEQPLGPVQPDSLIVERRDGVATISIKRAQ